MAEHSPQSVWPVNHVPSGFAIDNRAESPRPYPAGTEPTVTSKGSDLAHVTDLAK